MVEEVEVAWCFEVWRKRLLVLERGGKEREKSSNFMGFAVRFGAGLGELGEPL